MPEQDKHEEARKLAEQALDSYAGGDARQGDQLAAQAAKLDRSAVEEVVADLDEDADSNHDPAVVADSKQGQSSSGS